MTKTEKILKENLIRLRENRGLTPYRVAKANQINMSYYYGMEDPVKSRRINYEYLESLAAFYNVSVADLFTPHFLD